MVCKEGYFDVVELMVTINLNAQNVSGITLF